LYAFAQRGFGAVRARELFVSRFVRPAAGDRILDIGCGTGDILDHLPLVDYTGFDLSDEYIRAARTRYGERGTFRRADVLDADLSAEQPFDLVIAMGILHHLDDGRAHRLVDIACGALVPGGRLLTWDGTFVDGQTRVARWLIERDRGEYLREPEAYATIARQAFPTVGVHIVNDGLRVPYTHCVLDARQAAADVAVSIPADSVDERRPRS
jgi:cyclopropane fatty-acyl-phospholipid synthase-like methyltransferase